MTEPKDWISEFQDDPEYQFDRLNIRVGEEIVARMEALRLNRTALAKRMGVSKARVTQVLAGDDNLTMQTLVNVALALEADVSITLEPRSAVSHHRWQSIDAVDTVELVDDAERDLGLVA